VRFDGTLRCKRRLEGEGGPVRGLMVRDAPHPRIVAMLRISEPRRSTP
jgi:hypothetical protein